MLGDETLHIGQTAAGKMRPGDAEMVQELGEAGLDRRVPDGTDGGCYGRSPYSGSECAEWHSGPQLLASSIVFRGDDACWYWAAKLYSPRVRRSGPSISGGSRTGCKTSPALRRKDCRPNTVSNSVPFVLLGDRRQAHNLPLLLRQYMARQVVLVQPVHDQDDRTRKLVVQSAAERVVVPLVGRLPLGLRQRFLGLQRSSMTIMSAPRPVSTPPTQVAMRKACAVVSNSR